MQVAAGTFGKAGWNVPCTRCMVKRSFNYISDALLVSHRRESRDRAATQEKNRRWRSLRDSRYAALFDEGEEIERRT